MKQIFCLLLVWLMLACQSTPKNEKKPEVPVVTTPAPDFSGIEFASKKDLSCGMPLTAGIEDTAHYNGKIYGFCSKECKDAFLKNPAALVAKAK